MSIVGRLTLRNITGKPMRSLAIIVALAASAFALLYCIGGRDAPEQQLRIMLLNLYGGAEIRMMDTERNLEVDPAQLPAGSKVLLRAGVNATAVTAKGEYAVNGVFVEPGAALSFKITETELQPGDGVLISEAFAKKAGLKAGDSLTVNGDGGSFEFKVTAVSSDKYLRRNTMSLYMSLESVRKIGGITGNGYSAAFIDIPDDLDAAKTTVELSKKDCFKNYLISALLTDDMLDNVENQTMVFYLIFASIMLMTMFLTFSMSRHIANERLAVIGTLRSLGGSFVSTSRVLLIESAVYGLIGGALGAVGFVFGGEAAISAMFGSVPDDWSIPVLLYPAAVLFAIVIQLIAQAGALIKAVKTPVRDIIFSSRDTDYRLSLKKSLIGTVILAAGIVAGNLSEEIVMSIVALTLISVGAVMLLPLLLRGLSKVFVKLFAALKMPCAKLAASECSHKKSAVASTQLTFAALTITTAIFITALSIAQLYDPDVNNFDARIDISLNHAATDELLDMPEITEREYLSQYWEDVSINGGKKMSVCIAAYSDFKLYTGITGVGTEPADDELCISETFAKRLGIKPGDTLEITDYNIFEYDDNGKPVNYPVYKLKVRSLCSTMVHYNDTIVVSRNWFKKNYGDIVSRAFINLRSKDDIDSVRTKIEKVRRGVSVDSVEEINANIKEDADNILTILYGMTGVGCVLALLGAVSNAVIGFEQSRRKYAVLHSVAASKQKLSKLILLETLFSSLTAGVLAMGTGLILTSLIKTAMSGLGIGLEVVFDIPLTGAFIAALIAALLLSSIKPITSLRRMNTAVELKYE